MKKLIVVLLSIAMLYDSTSALAQVAPPTNLTTIPVREYYIANDLGRSLVTVHLLNGVTNPGVYHVPVNTDIIELISLAGGVTERSDLSGVSVRRSESGSYHIIDLNLEKALRDPSDLFKIRDRDVIQIEQKFSPDRVVAWVTVVSAIATVVLTAYLIRHP